MSRKIQTKDADLRASFAALKRASKKARQLSIATGTPFYIWRDGQVVDMNKQKAVRRGTRRKAS